MWSKSRLLALAAAALAAALTTGCSSDSSPAAKSSSGNLITGTVTVLAAASLTGTFTDLGHQFEQAHPGTHVTLSFGGSATLAQQIAAGAPADVFASASTSTMKTVTDANLASGAPTVFVRNQLVIVVPAGNPKGINGLADLTKPGLRVVLCDKSQPCGAAAATALAAAKVNLTPVSLEQDVKAALSKVTLGEVDAALVYRTDAKAAGSAVTGIEFPNRRRPSTVIRS